MFTYIFTNAIEIVFHINRVKTGYAGCCQNKNKTKSSLAVAVCGDGGETESRESSSLLCMCGILMKREVTARLALARTVCASRQTC